MFNVGEYVVYGQHGVCRVDGVGGAELSGIKNGRLYYALIPVYDKGGVIYTPVDNDKVTIRAILSKEEARRFIDEIADVEELWVADDKARERIYRDVLRAGNCRDLAKIIKALYARKQTRLASGKRVTMVDEKYLTSAQDYLYGELAIPLKMDRDRVEEYIVQKVQERQ